MELSQTPGLNDSVDALLLDLHGRIQGVLGADLLGLYLFGSLVWGDYDEGVSDMDLLAVLSDDLSPAAFAALLAMHTAFEDEHPDWKGRVEVLYFSVQGLQSYRSHPSPIGVISPGEPFHITEAGADWLINWWVVREQSRVLWGPPPTEFIGPIRQEEYLACIREHAARWVDWVRQDLSRPGQAYAVLTLCRAMYTAAFGAQTSKRKAAEWAAAAHPQWAELIRSALDWRLRCREAVADPHKTLPPVIAFVDYAAGVVLGGIVSS